MGHLGIFGLNENLVRSPMRVLLMPVLLVVHIGNKNSISISNERTRRASWNLILQIYCISLAWFLTLCHIKVGTWLACEQASTWSGTAIFEYLPKFCKDSVRLTQYFLSLQTTLQSEVKNTTFCYFIICCFSDISYTHLSLRTVTQELFL